MLEMSNPGAARRIVIAGGTGFLGRPLSEALAAAGCEITLLSRSGSGSGTAGRITTLPWTPDGSAAAAWAAAVDGAAAVVNLAGESIAGRRWTPAHKGRIRDSRLAATRSLAAAIAAAAAPPPVFVSGSAVGYYGPHADEVITEATPPGTDFLARVCVEWEAAAQRAASERTRVALLRTGIVLDRDGGALPQMLPPFWVGAGGPVGSGRQFWSWIHRHDWIAMVRWIIETPAASGPFNVTAPQPATNRGFAHALGRAMARPAFMPAPGFALKLLLGEMAEPLLLTGQRVLPQHALSLGFAFQYPELDAALAALFSSRRAA